MTVGSKLVIAFCIAISSWASAQTIVREGKITYERRTNLWKQFDDEGMRKWIGEKDKIKTEKFTLFFNDSVSLFSYVSPDEEDQMSWATMKNTVYNNFVSDKRLVYMDMMGSSLIVNDSLIQREWKITDKTRKIAGYECTRAIWQMDDSTRIYAWFTTDIIPTVGPENVQGLPGAILGLATEDGGTVYFATTVDLVTPKPEQIEQPKKKGKEYSQEELRTEMVRKMEGQPYGDKVLRGLFFW